LTDNGVSDPIWFEVPKSAKAPACVRHALKKGADLLFVWGGDGMVQQCIDAAAGSGVPIAILPAGTANLLATNLGIPKNLVDAVAVGLHGGRRAIDVGVMNGERFVVMAGAGIDGRIMGGVSKSAKAHMGRLAYFRSSALAIKASARNVRVKVDGTVWFDGKASCVLLGNVGTVTGGLCVFPEASPDDGQLEVGVVTAKKGLDWLRVLARVVTHDPDKSPLVHMTRGRKITAVFDRPMLSEIDGGERDKVKRLKVRIEPQSVEICVPEQATAS
jgi:diacylglycerol kinase family enzyme